MNLLVIFFPMVLFLICFVSPSTAFATDYKGCGCGPGLSVGSGNNGFKCGSQTFYCKNSDHACVNTNTPDQLTLDQDGDNFGGVTCKDPKDITVEESGIICTCKAQGALGNGTNSMDCKSNKGGTVTIECSEGNFACYNQADNVETIGTNTRFNGGGGGIYNTDFEGMKAKGIICKDPKTVDDSGITCKCDKSGRVGNDQNGFRCHYPGEADTTYQIYCADGNDACNDVTENPPLFEITGNIFGVKGEGNSDYDTRFKDHKAKGIRCGSEEEPTLPPPPSPPCKKDAWVDGQCTSFITALGDLGTNPVDFIQKLFGILLSLSGGIALLLIMKAGYMLMTSEGKPEQVQAGRDQLIAAIVGLLFLIFSLVFLQVIGYDILKIPGFTEGVGLTCDPNSSVDQCGNGLVCQYNGSGGTCQ